MKLRGFRIELSDIEAALSDAPGIAQAVVVLHREDAADDGDLVAYCRPAVAGAPLEVADLRGFLAGRLPAYMIPSIFVAVETFALNANGKIDRKRLPAVTRESAPDAGFTPPRTATEALVADLWAEILDMPRVSRDGHFFDLGGHSLLAARMTGRLTPIFGAAPPLRCLFERPRLADFCAELDRIAAPDARSVAIPRLGANAEPLLSFAQQRQWALARLEPENPFYNMPVAVRLTGTPDLPRLAIAFEHLADRHEMLRSRYPDAGGKPSVDVLPRLSVSLGVRAVPAEELEAALLAEARRPFDLAAGPLFRVAVFSPAPGAHVLLLVLHHIIADALSMTILLRDLARICRDLDDGRPIALPPLPLRYADFAAWQRTLATAPQIAWWRQELAGAPALLDLPTDFPRPALQGFAGDSLRLRLDEATTERLKALATRAGATPFMAVLAVFAILLGRYAASDDVVVGTPVAQRPHADLEGVVGMFVNTLAFRLRRRPDDSFAQLLARTRATVLDGFANQEAPFEAVVDALDLPRSWSHTPLFQAMFVWQADERRPVARPAGFGFEPLPLPDHTAKTDIALHVRDAREGLVCRIEYRTDLFTRDTIAAMADAFATLLKAVVAEPERPLRELSMVSAAERRQLRAFDAAGIAASRSDATLHGRVLAALAAAPDAIAVSHRTMRLTAGGLLDRSARLARHLGAMGIGRGDRVGIALPRGTDLVVALLAVLRRGAAYVPLDPRYPADRIAFVAEDADLSLLLADGAASSGGTVPSLDVPDVLAADETPDMAAGPADDAGVGPDDLAYLIYTSGSTGRPKGVAIEHRNAVAFLDWCRTAFRPVEMAGVLASTSICFDLSVFEIFATLAAGGEILMVDDLFNLADAPFADRVTLVNTVPTPMAELLRLGALPERAKTVCLAGEPLPPALAARLHASGSVTRLVNLYGPSEDTTYSTICEVPPDAATIGIGVPIAGTRAHVLDEAMLEVPVGMPGELFLGGDGVARGYWRRPDLTAERFLPDPYAPAGTRSLLYRTGDRVRRRADGSLDYLGRIDRQMKIRGFRIEPGEVEAALCRRPGVSGAVVDLWRDPAGHARLAAWIEGDPAPDVGHLLQDLRTELPDHLVPTLAVTLPALPRLPNGKLDRKALPDPTSGGERVTPVAAPISPTGQELAGIWRRLLGRDDIGPDDDFFSLGGDSILAIQVVAEARRAGMIVQPRDLFQHPALGALAAAIEGRAPIVAPDASGAGDMMLSPIQRWFLDRDMPAPAHWNQAVMLTPRERIDPAALRAALTALAARHPALRARFRRGDEGWVQHIAPPEETPGFRHLQVRNAADQAMTEAARALQSSFDLGDGPVFGALLADLDDGGQRLMLAAHHLVVDGISWRILLSDLQQLCAAPADLPPPAGSTSLGAFTRRLAACNLFDAELPYWEEIARAEPPPLPRDGDGPNTVALSATLTRSFDADLTRRLTREVPQRFPAEVQHLLVAALVLALRDGCGASGCRAEFESHGRPDLFPGVDLSESVGWFTALYPLLLKADRDASDGAVLLAVKDAMRRVPHHGVGYGVLRHLRGLLPAPEDRPVDLRFNYLGQTDALFGEGALFAPAGESAGPMQAGINPRDSVFEVDALVAGGRLHLRWTYGTALHRPETVAALVDHFAARLAGLVDHCLTTDEPGLTPADFPEMDFGQDDLDALLRSL
ncbi:non-ribosomal peptide synthetase [Methylobrevis pamukkalensis]|uniref:Linear gramicidin synthase subunit D n=1 Tax=Methylobrevis pamukkalensis TaxID=1439726 RepID=A0A1E3H787_9HYPH|nr:non-ribosomal peptide synthetase [Methylobrevis pamukkalensis]ODN72164.1 Linear gramicidin synthase subunit D [Methylobrevis pamukkalensis]